MNSIDKDAYPSLSLGWVIWGSGALFYLIGFYQRVAPAVMTGELMNDFQLGAAALGNLSAFYFYSYVAMQVPTGVLADRWGPRKLLLVGSFVAALGTFIFALAADIHWAGAGRLLIGGSVAVAFVALLKLSAHWLPPGKYALAAGLALFVGVIGAVSAGVPLRMLIDAFGWRQVMLIAACVTLVVCFLIWLLVRDDPSEKGLKSYHRPIKRQASESKLSFWRVVSESLTYRNILLLFLVPGGLVGPLLAFSGLWGVPYLTTHYAMQETTAAAYCSLLMIAWALGGPLFGWLSDYLGKRKRIYVVSCITLLIAWSLLFIYPDWSSFELAVFMIVIGVTTGVMVISFAFSRESAPSELTGTVSGLINMGVMAGPMVMQPAIGIILDKYWNGQIIDGVRIYSMQAYQSAFYLALVWLLISLILVSLTKETHCKPLYS